MALRRVNISPLGVSRRITPRPPRARRVILLLAGIAWLGYLAYFSDIRETWRSIDQAYAYLAGVFAIMIGLVVAGPWLTLHGSRLTARRANRPAGLIAARRLGRQPAVCVPGCERARACGVRRQLRHRNHHHHRGVQRRSRRLYGERTGTVIHRVRPHSRGHRLADVDPRRSDAGLDGRSTALKV